MTRSELIKELSNRFTSLTQADVAAATTLILEAMWAAMSRGDRVEIRGFGSFSTHVRPPRTARNPKTGAPVAVPAKPTPHFKPGLELRELVNKTFEPQIDVLPALKDRDSSCETRTSAGEDVLCCVDVAVVLRAAVTACPSSYSETCDTFRPCAASAARAGLG